MEKYNRTMDDSEVAKNMLEAVFEAPTLCFVDLHIYDPLRLKQ